MISKVKLVNSSSTWDSKKRYKTNEVVTLGGKTYQNITGLNSNPVLGFDWFVTNLSEQTNIEDSSLLVQESYFDASSLNKFQLTNAGAFYGLKNLGELQFAKAVDFISNFLKFYESSDENVDLEFVYKVNSLGTTSESQGLFFGWESTIGYVEASWGFQISNFAKSVANTNTLKFYNDAQLYQFKNTPICKNLDFDILANDTIQVNIMVRADYLYCIVTNKRTSQTTDLKIDFVRNAQFGISSFGFRKAISTIGKYKVGSFSDYTEIDFKSLKVTSKALQKPYLAIVGDSKTAGALISKSSLRWGELLSEIGTTQIWAGAGDRLEHALINAPYVIKTNPKNVLLCIGRNNYAQGDNLATCQQKYLQLVALYDSANIPVYHLCTMPETPTFDANIQPLNNWLKTNYPGKVIEITNAMGFDYAWVNDLIHPNDNAQNFIVKKIIHSNIIPISTDTINYVREIIKTEQDYLGYQIATPTTGQTVTINNGVKALQIEPAGTLATLTIKMPEYPNDGQLIHINSTKIVTALTFTTFSGTIVANGTGCTIPTNLAVNRGICFKYFAGQNKFLVWDNRL